MPWVIELIDPAGRRAQPWCLVRVRPDGRPVKTNLDHPHRAIRFRTEAAARAYLEVYGPALADRWRCVPVEVDRERARRDRRTRRDVTIERRPP